MTGTDLAEQCNSQYCIYNPLEKDLYFLICQWVFWSACHSHRTTLALPIFQARLFYFL